MSQKVSHQSMKESLTALTFSCMLMLNVMHEIRCTRTTAVAQGAVMPETLT